MQSDRGNPGVTVAGSLFRDLGFALGLLLFVAASGTASASAFALTVERPTMDRWVYPFNFEPATRPVAPTYGSFDPRFDTRDAQFLLGWDTASLIATNAGPARYLVRSLRVTLTSIAPVNPTQQPFVYDPTYDSYRTYDTNLPDATPDSDPGRPIELYGAAFRGGFTAETFLETSAFGPLGSINSGTISIGTRNAYAAMFDTNGELIDVANNVGQRNAGWTNAAFEARPWAIGTTTNAAPGEVMPDGGRMSFAVDLSDPLILGYVQRALNEGRLRLFISSLSPAGQSTPGGTGAGGEGAYPWWATKKHLVYPRPTLEIDGVVVSDEDTDADGLPDDWERFYFGDLAAAADGDPDGDGVSNWQEFLAGTDPRDGRNSLRVTSWTLAGDGRVTLEFPVVASREYVVDASVDLASWQALTGQLTFPTPGLGRWREAVNGAGAPAAVRFLRVRPR